MSTTRQSRQWRVKQLPEGEVKPYEDFELTTEDISRPLEEGEVLLKMLCLSNDPAQRTWLVDKPSAEHYMPPIKPGAAMTAGGVARVLESNNPEFSKDDLVFGMYTWSDVFIAKISTGGTMGYTKLPAGFQPEDSIALGLTALTAHVGLLQIAKATSEDKIVVVGGAAGATGSIVAQIAKNVLGVKTVWGVAGGPDKCKVAEQHGCDRCFDYKSPTFREDFEKAARAAGYVDVYFDNTGGLTTDTVLPMMNTFGRVAVCGAISLYEVADDAPCKISARSWSTIIYRKLKLEGFIVHQSVDGEYLQKATKELFQWAQEGKLVPLKDVWETPFDKVPEGMQKLLQSKNVGKLITKLVD